ncbi:MAG: ParB/RepB/Spo0J family partition protein [Methylophilus sp.]|uniref:ParB/RepB/Spo0J family partition protein n=1 Tax=Methylophilus sp. TaxID=29541 RepID=UPI003FA1617A
MSGKKVANEQALQQVMGKFATAMKNTGEAKPPVEPSNTVHKVELPDTKPVVAEQQPATTPAIEVNPLAETPKPALEAKPTPAKTSATHGKKATPAATAEPNKDKPSSTQPLKPAPNKTKPAETVVDENSDLLLVDLELLYDNPYNARSFYDPEVIKDKAASISASKQIVPIKAIPHPQIDGAYIMIDGHYRKRAIQFLNQTQARVIVDRTPMTDAQMYIQSFVTNNERTPQTTYDNAVAWSKLLEQGVFSSYDDLANAIHISKGNISKTLSALKLPTSCLEIIKEDPAKFSLRSLYELNKYHEQSEDEAFILELVKMLFDSEVSIDISQFIERHAKKQDRKPRSSSRKHTLSLGNNQVGYMKDWGTGRLTLEVEFQGDDREKFIKHMSSFINVK